MKFRGAPLYISIYGGKRNRKFVSTEEQHSSLPHHSRMTPPRKFATKLTSVKKVLGVITFTLKRPDHAAIFFHRAKMQHPGKFIGLIEICGMLENDGVQELVGEVKVLLTGKGIWRKLSCARFFSPQKSHHQVGAVTGTTKIKCVFPHSLIHPHRRRQGLKVPSEWPGQSAWTGPHTAQASSWRHSKVGRCPRAPNERRSNIIIARENEKKMGWGGFWG